MADLIERQIAALAPLGDVLVCGGAALLPAGCVERIDARRVIVTEPDPVRFSALERQVLGDPAFEMLPVMAGKADAKAELNRYNFRPASSLRPATGMRTRFPGLHVRDQIEVRVRDVAEIAKPIRREPGHRNMLIVSTPGEEADILSRLQEAGRLGIFDHVLVPLPEAPLYEGSACASDLLDLLGTAGYLLMARDDLDADMPQGHFYRPVDFQSELANCASEIENLRQRLSKAESNLTRAKEAAEAERENLLVRKDAEVSRVRTEALRVAAQYRIVQTILSPGAGS